MQPVPKIRQYMTPTPKTISYDQTLEQASDYMRKLHIRHLPVTKAGRPIGVVSDRDIRLLLAFGDLDALKMKVEMAVTPDPYFTSPDESIDSVVRQMANEKYGCVLLLEYDKVVGIFTTVDALRALADVFRIEENNT